MEVRQIVDYTLHRMRDLTDENRELRLRLMKIMQLSCKQPIDRDAVFNAAADALIWKKQ